MCTMSRSKDRSKIVRFGKRCVVILSYTVFLLVLLECTLRLAGWVLLLPHRLDKESGSEAGNEFRILAIGESTTYGLRVKPDQSYPKQLERMLNTSFSDRRFVVKNIGVPGQTSSSILRSIDSQLQKYKPDLVISLFGINDTNEVLNDFSTRFIFGSVYVPRWIADMRVYKLFSMTKDFLVHSPDVKKDGVWLFYDQSQVNPDGNLLCNEFYLKQLALNYKDVIDKVLRHHAEIMMISYVHRPNCFHELFDKVSTERNVVYLDLFIPDKERHNALFVKDRWHMSELGHRIIAERIFKCLVAENLIR